VKFQYDQEADALMISLKDGLVARSEEIDSGTLLDLDEHGNLLAIEVLRPARAWPLEEILAAHPLSDQDCQTLRALCSTGRYPFARELEFA
jgi:uncharacterized protein YuzE